MTDNSQIASRLAEARRTGAVLESYPGTKPADVSEAYSLQAEVTRALGWRVRGYKVGCTSVRAQQVLGLDRPFFGPVFHERFFENGASIRISKGDSRIVEPEIAFVMRHGLPVRPDPYSLHDVLAAVQSVHPAFEVVQSRLATGQANPVEWVVADGAGNDALVLGVGIAPLDPSSYAEIAVEARVNGRVAGTGIGRNTLDGPERVLAWLANTLREQGRGLELGDIVTTGLLTEVFRCAAGDVAEASFVGLGQVRVAFECD